MNPTVRRSRAGLAALLAALAVAACDGRNNFVTPPTGGGSSGGSAAADSARPTVRLEFPRDSANVARGDSVFVKAHVTDNRQLASLVLRGYSVVGDSILGTRDTVQRFAPKTVNFLSRGTVVTSDSVLRYLNATADTTSARRVLIVATATDSAGNSRSDTAVINVGGPRVSLVAPATGDSARAGTVLPVRVRAEDAGDRIRALRVRLTGATATDINVAFSVPREAVDTTLNVPLAATVGTVQVLATVTSGANLSADSRPVDVRVLPSTADRIAPRVTFNFSAQELRTEALDTLSIPVSAVDEVRVDTVGVTLRVRFRDPATGAATERFLTQKQAASSAVLQLPLGALGLTARDTVSLGVEVTAWATDAAGNCGAATAHATPQNLPCALAGGARVAEGVPGRLVTLFVARGVTARGNGVFADIASDGSRVFASNLTQNRVEVLPVGATQFASSIAVGSRPWGLAIGRNNDVLYVANSGGTNISVVNLAATTLVEDQAARIFTPNVQLYRVAFGRNELTGRETYTGGDIFDYSDRPQFIAQVNTGEVLYSTEPTGAAPDGTIRSYDPGRRQVEVFVDYAATSNTEFVVVNARGFSLVPGDTLLTVLPRRRAGDTFDPPAVTGTRAAVQARLAQMQLEGYDTRLAYVKIESVGLRDTTFVATSADRSTVAFGEGDTRPGRVVLFRTGTGSLQQTGNSPDLVFNVDETVRGVGLNGDGSLGAARGSRVYFFERNLRLQGTLASGVTAGNGGLALHPANTGYPNGGPLRRAFVSGEENGAPYIDVIDTFHFNRVRRIPIREAVTGTLIALPRRATDPAGLAVRVYALTASGVMSLDLFDADL